MRILYEQLLKDATLSSTNPDANYPVDNIYHDYLLLKYQSTTTTDTITADFTSDQVVSCVGISNHNLSAMSVKFYNSLSVLLDTQVIDVSNTAEMAYFTPVTGVSKIEFILTSLGDIYIGSIAVGAYLQMPWFDLAPSLTKQIRSDVFQSKGGQSTGQKRIVLRNPSVSFGLVVQSEVDEVELMINTVQNVDKIYIDLWEESHDVILPFYGRIVDDELSIGRTTDNGVIYDFDLEFVECK